MVTEGNPLFAEELLAMLIDEGPPRRRQLDGADEPADLPVPPTIHALLAAMLEALPDEEQALLARFRRGHPAHRVGGPAPASLEHSLELFDVVGPKGTCFGLIDELPDDEGFRFRHMLIRDAAYRSLEGDAGELHERFAAWLMRTAGPRPRRVRADRRLPPRAGLSLPRGPRQVDSNAQQLAVRGAELLESAGRRAFTRSDQTGAVSLLERAAALYPKRPREPPSAAPSLSAPH